jgi:predicted nucleic acid-binding protein
MADRILADINALSIQLVDDHPGHPYVSEALVPALTGPDTLVVFCYLPLRIQWILEDLGFESVDARNAVSSFLEYPMEFVDVGKDTIRTAYAISADVNHDVYDCFYLALARQADADVLCTTDTDFERLCADEDVEYRNPVPAEVLERFHAAGT